MALLERLFDHLGFHREKMHECEWVNETTDSSGANDSVLTIK